LDREILHKVIKGFSVGGESLIRYPEGFEAVKLGVEVNIATINATCIRNLSRAISQAGYIPSGFVFSPLAVSLRMLSEDDRSDRTAFISIRGKKIEVLFFFAGNLENCKVFDRTLTLSDKAFPNNAKADGYDGFFREVLSMRGWPDVRRVVISGTKATSEEFLQYAERSFAVPIRAGYPVAKPFEDLPEDWASYATALGIIDHLENGKKKTGSEY
jgi:cell division ATPase FtsA